MDGHFHGPCGHAQAIRDISLRGAVDIPGEPRFQRFEMVPALVILIFIRQCFQGASEYRHRPLTVKFLLGCGAVIGWIDTDRSIGASVQRHMVDIATTLCCLFPVLCVRDKVFDGAQEVGTEASPTLLEASQAALFQQAREKLVGQFAGRVLGIATAAEELNHRLVIGVA